MSKIKSALGEVVDFEMMKIMSDYGPAPITNVVTTNTKTTVVNPNALVRDTIQPQTRIMSEPVYATTVPVNKQAVKVETVQKITITAPESAEEVVAKTSKKGSKNVD